MEENILAIDIGGTSIKTGIVNGQTILEEYSFRNFFKGHFEDVIPAIKDKLHELINKYNPKKIGVGTAGEVKDGILLNASNLSWQNFNIKKDFEEEFKLPVSVGNDGNTAALAELKYGKLKGVSDGLFFVIGRGIGGALIINNKVYLGATGRAANFGHMIRHYNGRKCLCGRKGCFETYGSVLGLIQTVRDVNKNWDIESEKIDTQTLSGRIITSYFKENNKIVMEAINIWNNELADGIVDLCLVTNPKVVVIAGGITESGIVNIEQIKNHLVQRGFDDSEVYMSTFKGKTGLIGASLLTSEE